MKCTGSEILLPASFFKFQIMRKNKHAYTKAHTKRAIQFQSFSYIRSEKAWKDNTDR